MAAKKKFYSVKKGRKPGIYTTWFGPAGAQVQIDRFQGAVFKGFATRQEAEAFMKSPAPSYRPTKKAPAAHGRPTGQQPGPSPGSDIPAGETVTVYTDGGALNNPGPGGYGTVIIRGKDRTEISGGFRKTTNNRMELMACIVALEKLTSPSAVTLYSDSRYVVDGITKGWARRWQKNGWMRTKTDPAVNPDLWERLLALCRVHAVTFVWVKGHAGNPENERCDRLAVDAAHRKGLPPDKIYEATKLASHKTVYPAKTKL